MVLLSRKASELVRRAIHSGLLSPVPLPLMRLSGWGAVLDACMILRCCSTDSMSTGAHDLHMTSGSIYCFDEPRKMRPAILRLIKRSEARSLIASLVLIKLPDRRNLFPTNRQYKMIKMRRCCHDCGIQCTGADAGVESACFGCAYIAVQPCTVRE